MGLSTTAIQARNTEIKVIKKVTKKGLPPWTQDNSSHLDASIERLMGYLLLTILLFTQNLASYTFHPGS